MVRSPSALVDEKHQHLLRWATYASVATAGLLVFIKLLVWLWSDSLALLASLTDSLVDLSASLINLLAVRYALKPADSNHRYGHGKAEALAGIAQAAFISGSALFLLLHALERLLQPTALQADELWLSVVVMLFSTGLTLGLVRWQGYVVKRTGSLAIRADAMHYKADLWTNLGILAALLLVLFGLPWADPVMAGLVALIILKGAWDIGGMAIQMLMDQELPKEVRQKIVQILGGYPQVYGFHDLRTRRSGQRLFVQLHVDLQADTALCKAHAIAQAIEADIAQALDNAEVIVHQDPVESPPVCVVHQGGHQGSARGS